MDREDQMESIEVYDPVKKCHFRISIPHKLKNYTNDSENEEEIILEEEPAQTQSSVTVWTQHESLALINLFALHKDTFKASRNKKALWKLISKELLKIGIQKPPEKCDIKWRNLLRVYRQHVQEKRGRGKFELFNELNSIVANDPQFRYLFTTLNNSTDNTRIKNDSLGVKDKLSDSRKRKCSCSKSEKQKRHDERVALMTKKLEIEERKVKAFEDYLEFLKSNSENL